MVGHQGLLLFRFPPTLRAIRRHSKAHRGRHLNPCLLRTRCLLRGLFNTQQLGTMPSTNPSLVTANLSLVICGLRWLRPPWVPLRPQQQHGPCLQECHHIRRMVDTRSGNTRLNSHPPSKFPREETRPKLRSDGQTMPIAWIPLLKDRTVRPTYPRAWIFANAPCPSYRWARSRAVLGKNRRSCH